MNINPTMTTHVTTGNWRKLGIIALIHFVMLDVVSGKVLHVRPSDAQSQTACGQSSRTACATLSRALSYATNDDTIYVHEGLAGTDDWLCDQTAPSIHTSVQIVGNHHDLVHVGCKGDNRAIMINITNPDARVVFRNIFFHVTLFFVQAGDVTFENCFMNMSKWFSMESADPVIFRIYNSTWKGFGDSEPNCTVMCTPSGYLEMIGHSFRLELLGSMFYQTRFNMTAAFRADVDVIDTVFTNTPGGNLIHGGMFITIQNETNNSTVLVRNSTFDSQINAHPIDSIMNLYVGAFIVMTARPRPHGLSKVVVLVEDSVFSNNERGLTFVGPYMVLNISNSYFLNNIAMHAGAGFLVFVTMPYGVGRRVYITNCTFESNAAGSFRQDLVEHYRDSFQVSGDEVRIHSPCCKGVISFVGKGGAIRVQKGNVTLTNCIFRNNTARLLGGAIFVDRASDLIIDGSVFENSPIGVHPIQGDLLYSNGIVSIKSARLLVLTADSHTAALRHSGNHWSIEVADVSIQCPVGYRLRVTNTSAYGVTSTGLRRSYKLDQLSYFCESCPRNKYSLDFGFLNYSLTYSRFDYDTLLIDGNRPDNAYNGTYIYHDIECQTCPYGGKCQQGIVAVPNFWGYIQANHVKFQHCPKGYCCSSMDCKSFDTCGKHRQGMVCGECEDGFSEALFSSACVPDDLCDPSWLWPVALGSGLLYTMFLLFQKDIRDLMYLKTGEFKEMPIFQTCFGRERKQKNIDPTKENIFHGTDTNFDRFANCEQTELQALKSNDPDIDMEIRPVDAISNKNNNDKRNGFGNRRNDNIHGDTVEDDVRLTKDQDEDEPAQAPADTGASFLIILFYYFQDAQLLQIKTVFASAENRSQSMLKEILAGLFKFRVEVFQFMDKFCFLSGLTPTFKLLYKITLVPYVLFQFGLMYLIFRWCSTMKHSEAKLPKVAVVKEDENGPPKKTFSSRLATGFVLSLLFTYQMLATTSLTLLNCVPVGEKSVLFIEGTVVCYQGWQYGVMAYVVSCIVPFCLVLLIGPGLLKDGLISLPQFFCACIVPLPFLFYWLIVRARLYGKRPSDAPEMLPESQAVINILQGPFKDATSNFFGPLCGAGVLIGRRLILVLLFTFVNDTLIRMLCMMLVCFIILLHHVHVLPYKDTRCNVAGTMSAAALVIVGAINLVRAGFEAAEYIPLGPNAVLMAVFEELENVLMLWFPAAVMSVVIIAVTVKVILLLLNKCFLTKQNNT